MSEIKFRGVCFGETDRGRVRTNNEDTYICQFIWDKYHILCAAIDGLGGYEGGEIAAEIARVTIIKHLEEFASKKTSNLLKDAIIDANNEIIHQHEVLPKIAQMGCVASVGLIDLVQGIITIAHVGDSRIYQLVNGELKKLTHDHSLVGYREDIGEMSEEEAMHHPQRNLVEKFLGEQYLPLGSTGYVEISVCPIIGDTQYLFCSDGLTDLITSAQISEVLSSGLSIADKARRLITCANDAGGKDNITVVIANIMANVDVNNINKKEPELEMVPKNTKKKRTFLSPVLSGICGLIVGLGVQSIYNLYKVGNQTNGIYNSHIELRDGNDKFKRYIVPLEDSISKSLANSSNDSTQIDSDTLSIEALQIKNQNLEKKLEQLNEENKSLKLLIERIKNLVLQ